ncbi:transcriptional regulator [Hydrangea phyllody phytoplasma]|uniref:Transcriptional regulator n=2 Tax=16SrI (Aster yellows group) TaxID=3042590 RepID=A0ABQ5PSA4_9MOLU|nr:HU family DNA-binding protein [Hydrangea phyllody phytoplasma]GFZ75562.1 transcriptional regulator [Hydrangea phyllody phytoplasma]GLH61233.1 transcriptional regulator [Rhus yellows phytoplasma]GLH62008.1 transcriptional regulator [Hydrangea phyllody phytoplasma]GLH62159.1 transcriptional regulator [Hydrangea phyllody phytoplasma]
MTKKELIKEVAKQLKTSVAKTEEFYNSFENTLIESITSNEEVVLSPQLGKFVLKSRNARAGRNPQTGKRIKIPSKTVVTFKLSKNLKDKVKTLKLE